MKIPVKDHQGNGVMLDTTDQRHVEWAKQEVRKIRSKPATKERVVLLKSLRQFLESANL